MPTFLQSLRLQKLLSFGPETEPLHFGALTVLTGPNGSGKSNLLEAVGLLAATPRGLGEALRTGGGMEEWLWKGGRNKRQAVLEAQLVPGSIHYTLTLTPSPPRLALAEERIEQATPVRGAEPVLYFGHRNAKPYVRKQGTLRKMDATGLDPTESILSQLRDPSSYPELFALSEFFLSIRLYRGWSFGRAMPARQPQPTDLPNDNLLEDGRNLGLVLNRIRRAPAAKETLLEHLSLLSTGVRDVDVSIEGGMVQVFLHENRWIVPAHRLSDGTLRWLSLLALLLNPTPQTLVCIEEPELGLHRQLLPALARLLRAASERMQLIVTTHSDDLVEALQQSPGSVLICEKHEGSTTTRRLETKRG